MSPGENLLCRVLRGPRRVRLRVVSLVIGLALFVAFSIPGVGPLMASGAAVGAVAETGSSGDRQALVSLYQAANGVGWARSTNWLTDTPIGQWGGVTTNEIGRVTGLAMPSNGLTGDLPVELGDLGELRVLNLQGNYLSGVLQTDLGNLGELRVLDLHGNSLYGEIPVEFERLGELTGLETRLQPTVGTGPRIGGNAGQAQDPGLERQPLRRWDTPGVRGFGQPDPFVAAR